MKAPLFIVLLVVLSVFAASTASAGATERTVSVEGHCTRSTVADRGSITLTAEDVDPNLKDAASQVTRTYQTVKNAVEKLGLENLELKTSEYSVTEDREWQKDRSVFKGYRVRMGLSISTSSIQRLGEVIAIAAREGVKDVGSLTTSLSPEKRKKEEAKCLEDAALDARSRAEKLASALGAKVGAPITILEGAPAHPPRPVPLMAMRAAPEKSDEIPPPSVEAGQQEIHLNVQVTFGLN